MANKDTLWVQNIIKRLSEEMVMDHKKPSAKERQLYGRVKKSFVDLDCNLDLLNDLIELNNEQGE